MPVTDKDEKTVAEVGSELFRTHVKIESNVAKIDAEGVYYQHLSTLLRALQRDGFRNIEIRNVYGQRYIGTNLARNIEIIIHGTPGNDLGAFMNSPKITVYGNAQDGCGNTMNGGLIVVHGHAGDVAGYSMRGGKIFIRDDVGYRAGIHMKGFQNIRPCMVIGGTARDFLGEYMAGGVILILGLNLRNGERHKAKFVGTGMHGGVIYVCREITNVGREVAIMDVEKGDTELIRGLVREFSDCFGFDFDKIVDRSFRKIVPVSHRPYGRLYAY